MNTDSNSQEEPASGGDPEGIGRCTRCGNTYAIQDENGELRPIGTDGKCDCGNDEFEPVAETGR